jgi:hypothetical protein
VILASVLFFGGIAPRFERVGVRYMILSLAVIMLILGVYRLLTLPVEEAEVPGFLGTILHP